MAIAFRHALQRFIFPKWNLLWVSKLSGSVESNAFSQADNGVTWVGLCGVCAQFEQLLPWFSMDRMWHSVKGNKTYNLISLVSLRFLCKTDSTQDPMAVQARDYWLLSFQFSLGNSIYLHMAASVCCLILYILHFAFTSTTTTTSLTYINNQTCW